MNRLKELRLKHGYKSQQDLANVLFVNQTAVSQWERGVTVPSSQMLKKLSEMYGVSIDYILGTTEYEQVPAPESERSNAVCIPVLGTIPAGIPMEAIEDILDWEEIPASMCRGGKEYFALQVKGDSMWPDYLSGDVVIVRKDNCFESGDDCVVYINGYNATLKQVEISEDGSLSIIPRNPNYPPKTYSPQEVTELPISIAGVVVELRRKVK